MTKERKIKRKLDHLKEEIKEILRQIKDLEQEIFDSDKSLTTDKNHLANYDSPQKSKFVAYLRDVANVKETTISDYLDDLKHFKALIKRYLNKDIKADIFDIKDVAFLRSVVQELLSNKDFDDFNRKKHHHFSAPLNNYVKFLEYTNNSFIFED